MTLKVGMAPAINTAAGTPKTSAAIQVRAHSVQGWSLVDATEPETPWLLRFLLSSRLLDLL